MSLEKPIILFDLPSKDQGGPWSPNTWKSTNTFPLPENLLTVLLPCCLARLLLNYKGIPYTTQWIELDPIAPHFKSLGIPPNPPSLSSIPYTVPTIRLPNGSYVMDSKNIAAILEEKYPDPPLHLDSPQLAKAEEILPQLFMPLRGILLPGIGRNLMTEESLPYFSESRSKKYGSLEQMERELSGEKQWEEPKPAMREIAALIEETGGPFVLGREVSYADFNLVGVLSLFKRLGDGVFEKTVEMKPALRTLYEASKKWLEKDD
ncbi:MAG: hypothetical protein Q9215_003337 [Flavoplaca cf. flavocitrina]